MRGSAIIVALIAMIAFCGVAAEGDALYERNKALRKEVAELRLKVNAAEDECVRLEKSVKTLDTTRELMTGKRKTPPKMVEKMVQIAAFHDNGEEKSFVRTDAGEKAIEMHWLSGMKVGAKYRCECLMAAEDVKGCKHIKFGAMVGVPGQTTQWPAASVGAGTFQWRKVSFDYVFPSGASFCLLYGIESGTGKVTVKDVKVFEVVECEAED